MGLRIAFLRPRLGIGEAERLVVDAAHELIGKGHDLAFHVPVAAGALAFDDIPAGMPFHRTGAWVPEHVGGRLRLPFAIARTLTAARSLVSARPGYDVVICDVVPHVIPWLKRRTSARLLYFGHFPDLPLTPRDDWYGWYRGPFDRWQSQGLAAADRILVNSRFTASAFRDAYPNLASAPLIVVHPGITVPSRAAGRREGHRYESPAVAHDAIVLLAMGRFDPRKNLPLAIQAFDAMRGRVAPDVFARTRLVFIGPLDKRVPEARQVREELGQEARARHLERQVMFVESPTDAEQAAWLDRALVVVYTPKAEHFGIVPLEAMAAGRPVVAVNHGGPLETVIVGKTGLLCEASPDAFASAIARFVKEPELARRMGAEGRAHVDERFSRERFGDQLDAIVRQLAAGRPGQSMDQPLSSTGRASLAHPSSHVGRADRRAPERSRVSSDGSSG